MQVRTVFRSSDFVLIQIVVWWPLFTLEPRTVGVVVASAPIWLAE